MHLKNNPEENEKALRKRLIETLADYKNGIKCSCGNDIWVIGAASVGNSCFSCITGEGYPTEDYEIESAVEKRQYNHSQQSRNIDDIPISKISGFFDDDGNEIKMDLIIKPSLCISCINNDDPNEEIFCNMTRHDQKNASEFICFAYANKK